MENLYEKKLANGIPQRLVYTETETVQKILGNT